MKANEAVLAMLGEAGLSRSRAAELLGTSRQNVSMDTLGYAHPGRRRGMTVGKLAGYAGLCGYRVVLVPDDPARPEFVVDGDGKGGRRAARDGGGGRP